MQCGNQLKVGIDLSQNGRGCHLWYLKTLKFGLPPKPTPNASRWNIGGVGSPTQRWPCRFHVVCVPFTCGGWPTRTQFQVEYGLKSDASTALYVGIFLLLDSRTIYGLYWSRPKYNYITLKDKLRPCIIRTVIRQGARNRSPTPYC